MKKVVYLCGGLGNNIFQILKGEELKLQGYDVIYECTLIESNALTKMLGWFIHDDKPTKKLLKNDKVIKIGFFNSIFVLFLGLMLKVRIKLSLGDSVSFLNHNLGYYQNVKFKPDAIKALQAKKNEFFILPPSDNCFDLVVHIRRGDFSSTRILPFDYYLNAVRSIKLEGLSVLLLTSGGEDVSDICGLFRSACRVEVKNNSKIEHDFIYIGKAKTLIMSNSTFCYWGYVLGDNQEIYYPTMIERDKAWSLPLYSSNVNKVDFCWT